MSDKQTFDSSSTESPHTDAQTPFQEFLQHQKNAFEETGKAFDSLLPPPFKEHSENARQEFIKSFKVLVDAAIDGMENFKEQVKATPDDNGTESTTGTKKVKVQVE